MPEEASSHAHFVFLSYRREDTESASELLYVQLVERFRSGAVLKDIHDISLGDDFRGWIERNVRACCAMLVVIGPNWVRILQERREKEQADYVLAELVEARRHGVPTFAVLVDGAVAPSPGDLPGELVDFTFANSFEIPRPPHFRSGVTELAARLARQFPGLVGKDSYAVPAHVVRARKWMIAATLALLGVVAWDLLAPQPRPDGARLAALLHETIWLEYSPPREEAFSWLDEDEQVFLREEIEENLRALKAAGFTGILANGDTGVTHLIPRSAKALGLKVIIICGLTGNRGHREQTLARVFNLREFADAICIGYNGLGTDYQLDELRVSINRMRRRCGLPVTTTQPASRYVDNPPLVHAGDWLFPDICLDLIDDAASRPPPAPGFTSGLDDVSQYTVNVTRDVDRFMAAVRPLAGIAKREDKTLVFNGVCYPHSYLDGAGEDSQAAYFARLLDALRSPRAGPDASASIVAHGSHDREWKPFYTTPSGPPKLRPGMSPWMSAMRRLLLLRICVVGCPSLGLSDSLHPDGSVSCRKKLRLPASAFCGAPSGV